MPRLLLIPLLLVAASALALSQTSGVDTRTKDHPLAGTWKANLSKSHQHANHLFESATLHIEVTPDAVLLTYIGINMSGEQESGTTKLHPDGRQYPIAEAPGMVEVSTWVGTQAVEMVVKKDGKVIGQSTYEVSGDGKTLTAKVKGIDASGAEFEQVIVFDRQ